MRGNSNKCLKSKVNIERKAASKLLHVSEREFSRSATSRRVMESVGYGVEMLDVRIK